MKHVASGSISFIPAKLSMYNVFFAERSMGCSYETILLLRNDYNQKNSFFIQNFIHKRMNEIGKQG